MREMTIETASGEQLTLAATFKASIEVADKVEDPLLIAREAAMEAAMLQARMPYRPRFDLNTRNVSQIIYIGLKAAGSKLTTDQVNDLVFSKGLVHARLWAADYIALLVEPKPTKPDVEPEDEISDEDAAGNAPGSEAGAGA